MNIIKRSKNKNQGRNDLLFYKFGILSQNINYKIINSMIVNKRIVKKFKEKFVIYSLNGKKSNEIISIILDNCTYKQEIFLCAIKNSYKGEILEKLVNKYRYDNYKYKDCEYNTLNDVILNAISLKYSLDDLKILITEKNKNEYYRYSGSHLKNALEQRRSKEIIEFLITDENIDYNHGPYHDTALTGAIRNNIDEDIIKMLMYRTNNICCTDIFFSLNRYSEEIIRFLDSKVLNPHCVRLDTAIQKRCNKNIISIFLKKKYEGDPDSIRIIDICYLLRNRPKKGVLELILNHVDKKLDYKNNLEIFETAIENNCSIENLKLLFSKDEKLLKFAIKNKCSEEILCILR